MKRFEISITYSKIVEAADEEDARQMIERIASEGTLDGEYGPFSSDGHFTQVEALDEDLS